MPRRFGSTNFTSTDVRRPPYSRPIGTFARAGIPRSPIILPPEAPVGGGGSGAIGSAKVATIAETNTLTTLPGNAPPALAVGDLMLCAYASTSTPANTTLTTSGWTAVPGYGTSGGEAVIGAAETLGVFYRYSDGSANDTPSVTVSAVGRLSVAVLAFSGVDPTTPFDVNAQYALNNGAVSQVVVPSLTPATTGAKIVGIGAMDSASTGTLVIPTEMVQLATTTGTGRRLTLAHETTPASAGVATGTRTWGESGTSLLPQAATTIALRPAPGGTGPTPFIGWGWGVAA